MICSCHFPPTLPPLPPLCLLFYGLGLGLWQRDVSEREMADWALTQNNGTGVGDQITGTEGLAGQIGG